MRVLKTEAGKIIGLSSNDEPSAKQKAMEETMITTTNIEQVKAKNEAKAKGKANEK